MHALSSTLCQVNPKDVEAKFGQRGSMQTQGEPISRINTTVSNERAPLLPLFPVKKGKRCDLRASLVARLHIGCIKKVIELWSSLARLLYNLQKSLLHNRKDQAFNFRLSPFLWNLKKNSTNTNQMKITGWNRIFSPLRIIKAANKKRKFINHSSVTRNY